MPVLVIWTMACSFDDMFGEVQQGALVYRYLTKAILCINCKHHSNYWCKGLHRQFLHPRLG